jgi:hypothetical protein
MHFCWNFIPHVHHQTSYVYYSGLIDDDPYHIFAYLIIILMVSVVAIKTYKRVCSAKRKPNIAFQWNTGNFELFSNDSTALKDIKCS